MNASENYFHRVAKLSPTRMWINNPTREQTDWAIAEGALGCTTNPSYTQKMLDNPKEAAYASSILEQVLREFDDDHHAAVEFQHRLVQPIAEKFMKVYKQTNGEHGYVSIQDDPFRDEDAKHINDAALENRKLSPNICCKIPTTAAGIKAMQSMVPMGIPQNATECFGVSQLYALCESYEKLAKESGKKPFFAVSHIAGIYDDYLKNYVKENHVDISQDVLFQAGLAVARKVYDLMIDEEYNAVFVGGGARGLHHFTEMVGGKVFITINWEGTADKLLELNPPVVYRLFNPVPPKVIDELLEKLPDFRKGYLADGLSEDEFEGFGPVQLFRSSFVKSWSKVLEVIKERRKTL